MSYAKVITGYALTWSTPTRSRDQRGRAQPFYTAFSRDGFDDWLVGQPTGGPFLAEHETILGEIIAAEADDVGLRVTGKLDDSDAAERVYMDVLFGRIGHFSCHVVPGSERQRPYRRDGLPVYDLGDAELLECGPTSDPADPGARIVSVCGREDYLVPSYVRDLERAANVYDEAQTLRQRARALDREIDAYAAYERAGRRGRPPVLELTAGLSDSQRRAERRRCWDEVERRERVASRTFATAGVTR